MKCSERVKAALFTATLMIDLSAALPQTNLHPRIATNLNKTTDLSKCTSDPIAPLNRLSPILCYHPNARQPRIEVDQNLCHETLSSIEDMGVQPVTFSNTLSYWRDQQGNCDVLLEKPEGVGSATFSPIEIVRAADRILRKCSGRPPAFEYGGRGPFDFSLFDGAFDWKVTVFGRSTSFFVADELECSVNEVQ